MSTGLVEPSGPCDPGGPFDPGGSADPSGAVDPVGWADSGEHASTICMVQVCNSLRRATKSLAVLPPGCGGSRGDRHDVAMKSAVSAGRAAGFAERVRAHEITIGYWSVINSAVVAERLGQVGYDFVVLDGQHGFFGYADLLHGLIAIDASPGAVGLVRVEANSATPIGRALDAGAAGVIVPLINNAADAAAAVAATRYPPAGIRSFGPARSNLRIGPDPLDTNDSVLVFAMIETADGLADVEQIAATPGLDGIYVGPSDLRLAVGGATESDESVQDAFDAALIKIKNACTQAGIVAGMHTPSAEVARQRIEAGFTFVAISSDLSHLAAAAAGHLERAHEAR